MPPAGFEPTIPASERLQTVRSARSPICTLSPNNIRVIKSRRMRWLGHVARMGERRGARRVLVGKPEVTRPLRRSRLRWEDKSKMDFLEVGWGRYWNDLAQDRDRRRGPVNATMNLWVP